MSPKPAPPKRWTCPHPEKMVFSTELEAKMWLLKEHGIQVTQGKTGLRIHRVYPCVCRMFHTTSK